MHVHGWLGLSVAGIALSTKGSSPSSGAPSAPVRLLARSEAGPFDTAASVPARGVLKRGVGPLTDPMTAALLLWIRQMRRENW